MKYKEFVKESKKIHGNLYVYSKTEHTQKHKRKTRTVVHTAIKCRKHGIFWQSKFNHLMGKGCYACGREATGASRRLSTHELNKRLNKIHNSKYEYLWHTFTFTKNKMSIICPTHGIFEQKVNNHINGKGCRICAYQSKKSKEHTIKEIKSRSELKPIRIPDKRTAKSKITFECRNHGQVETNLRAYIVNGCALCAKQEKLNIRMENSQKQKQHKFIKLAKELYGKKFSYKKVVYTQAKNEIIVTCVKHGDFKTTPNSMTWGRVRKKTKTKVKSMCPICTNEESNSRTKVIKLNNKQFKVRGYEKRAIIWLRKYKGFKIKDMQTGIKVPRIAINFTLSDGHTVKTHVPDIYIEKHNLIVEVKSTGTFGLTPFHTDSDDLLNIIKHKSQRAKRQGYNYKVLLFGGQKRKIVRIPLPVGWDTMTNNQLRKWYASQLDSI